MKTRQQSKQLKDDGVVIFALGIGSNVDAAELNALASEESGVFRFASVREMLPKENALNIAWLFVQVPNKLSVINPVVYNLSLSTFLRSPRLENLVVDYKVQKSKRALYGKLFFFDIFICHLHGFNLITLLQVQCLRKIILCCIYKTLHSVTSMESYVVSRSPDDG